MQEQTTENLVSEEAMNDVKEQAMARMEDYFKRNPKARSSIRKFNSILRNLERTKPRLSAEERVKLAREVSRY